MRRWHSERNLMVRRWRQELAWHSDSYAWIAPPSLAPAIDCHCARGIGTMRKRTPLGCNRPRCQLCHYEKLFPPDRGSIRRRAIEFD